MKKILWLLSILLAASFALTACGTLKQIFNPTPPPPPVGENDTWSIKILGIEKYREPVKFVCSDCDRTNKHSELSLQPDSSYIKVKLNVINKTDSTQHVSDVTLGLLLLNLRYGCGGVTIAGSDFCLPSGMIRNGMNYVNYGIDTPEFQDYLFFEPNTPDGENIDLIFLIDTKTKYEYFYFDGLKPLNVKKVKPVAPESLD